MSEALTYLLKARPDAVSHYFAFLKACGTHLDPKTRNLISVITKVDAQTERGFKQYLKRALAEGCSPMEVLDALLMAFPTLGLTKIVWAVDIILAMKLPGFDPDALAQPPAAGKPAASPPSAAKAVALPPATAKAAAIAETAPAWHDVLATQGFKVGDTQRVDCDGRSLFVHRSSAKDWQVYDSRCPHQATNIPHLALQGHQLTCPKHGWAFDVRSGGCTAVGDRGLTRWPHRVVKGRLLAQW
jgi:nitrite reductase/ring-hydroxylating ferredoxin subunit/alkylhydroperoxidase/carboxymuconolactone decarboxylase family protein YurZ